jgi:cyclopropane-fatty-acyl-phospholipid synthase
MSARVSRTIVFGLLARIAAGSLTVIEGGASTRFGSGPPAATVQVHSERVWPLLLRGSRGLASAYELGLWDSPDLVALVRLAARNAASLDRARAKIEPLLGPPRALAGIWARSTKARRRAEIAAHYDLGNELFERMLDPTLSYSSAVFEHPRATLQEAQVSKLELICQKLDLSPGEHLLEIGTGWGALAIHAARTRGVDVTTTTISREQHAYATAQVERAGLQDRVTVLMRDYTDLTGSFDKLASIEMIEAVGWRRLGTYFDRCSRLLRRGGAMLLQAIVIDDRAYRVERASRSFINTRIFPGGCLPSVEAISSSLARRTDLQIVDLEDITAHYVMTLQCWRRNFESRWPELERLGYDERFRRLWTLYLAYCEAGFAERRICDVQLLLAKPGWRDHGRDRDRVAGLRVAPARALSGSSA